MLENRFDGDESPELLQTLRVFDRNILQIMFDESVGGVPPTSFDDISERQRTELT